MTDEKINIGDIVKVDCLFKSPNRQSNFYLFDYQKYLLSKNISKICYPNKIKKIKTTKNIILLSKRYIRNKLEKRKNKAYYKLFLLGSKEDIKEEVNTSFIDNGISHLFAISGMHITFIVLLLNSMLKKINNRQTIIMIVLINYLLLANFTYSLFRSVILYIFIIVKNKFNVQIKNQDFLIFLAFIIWFFNPYCFYDLGFVFSFVITFFLLCFSNIIKSNNILLSIIKISFFTFFIGIPISIKTNYSINLLTPFFNIFFVPFITYLFLPILFISFIFLPLNFILTLLINILEKSSLFLSNINSFTLVFGNVSIIVVIFYYVIFYFTLKNFNKIKVFLLLIVFIFHYFYPNLNNNNYLEMLDVGQGDSILITLNNKHLLVDTGGVYGSDRILDNILLPSLKARGIKKIDYLIITHGDLDHMKESIKLIDKFKVDKVIFNNDKFNDLENNLKEKLDKKKIKYYKNIKELKIANNNLYFLNTKLYDNENDNSNVIYFKYYNYKFLLMGDASTKREKDIINKYTLKNIDFLKVGHHGSDTSSSKEFIDTIKPRYSLISVGANNKYGHPKKKTLKNLKSSKVYRTDMDGSIKIIFNKKSFKIKTVL